MLPQQSRSPVWLHHTTLCTRNRPELLPTPTTEHLSRCQEMEPVLVHGGPKVWENGSLFLWIPCGLSPPQPPPVLAGLELAGRQPLLPGSPAGLTFSLWLLQAVLSPTPPSHGCKRFGPLGHHYLGTVPHHTPSSHLCRCCKGKRGTLRGDPLWVGAILRCQGGGAQPGTEQVFRLSWNHL